MAADEKKFIDDEIALLSERESDLSARIAGLSQDLDDVKLQLGVLRRLKAKITASNGKPGRKLTATAAIRQALAQRPMTNAQLADALEGQIDTTSATPRKLIFSSIEQLLNNHRITRDPVSGLNELVEDETED